ncbi:MAG: UbiA family prenyltransferase [Methanobacteriota archaeon]
MRGYLGLARPWNAGMSAAGVVVGGIVAVGPGAFLDVGVPLGLAAAAAASFTAGGNALNDIADRATDAVNHPDRPLPSGRLTVRQARAFAGASFGVAAVLGALVNVWCLAIVLANALLMYAYESGLKAGGFPGNVAIAYLVGSLFLFAGFASYAGDAERLSRVGVLAALAFLATVGREVAKDIEDLAGDVDRRTLPKRIGARRAGAVAALAFVAGVAFSVVPWSFALLGLGYVATVVVADGMFIYAALHSATRPARAQRVAKYAMVVALAAFLAGGVR